jgi:hypothetical protein
MNSKGRNLRLIPISRTCKEEPLQALAIEVNSSPEKTLQDQLPKKIDWDSPPQKREQVSKSAMFCIWRKKSKSP